MHTGLEILYVCTNQAPSNYSGQEYKNHMQFMTVTYL